MTARVNPSRFRRSARRHAGQRPTLPAGERLGDVLRRRVGMDGCDVLRCPPVAGALPGSGAALLSNRKQSR